MGSLENPFIPSGCSMAGHDTTDLQLLLDRYRNDEPGSLDQLLTHTQNRLLKLAKKTLFRREDRLHRWEETADVLQNTMIRLFRALKDEKPRDACHFFNLAAQHLRWELRDLARHYFGPEGLGKHHKTGQRHADKDEEHEGQGHVEQTTHNPAKLQFWTEFHQKVDELPSEEKEIFSLHWYHGLSLKETGILLGVPERTVHRRWAAARINLKSLLPCEAHEISGVWQRPKK